MAYQTIEATSVVEIIELINGKHHFFKSQSAKFYYRGHSSDSWSLIPSVFRNLDTSADDETKQKVLKIEQDIYYGFYNNFRGLITPHIDNNSSWEVLCYAQHYGIPTRLLDWTTNPFVALFFAVIENPNKNAVLWCCARDKEYNKPLNQLPEELSFLRQFKKYQPEDLNNNSISDIVMIQPPAIDVRIRNQAGFFSVQYTSDPNNLVIDHVDELGKKAASLLKIQIPAIQKMSIKRDLEKFGIDPIFIYPDIQGIGQSLRIQKNEEYIEKEISISPLIKFMKNKFTEQAHLMFGSINDMLWEWHPNSDFQFTLKLDSHLYSVRLEQIKLENKFEAIETFVKKIEQILLQENNLKGSYLINFAYLRNWQKFDYTQIEQQILSLIRETKYINELEEKIHINKHHIYSKDESIEILKIGCSEDFVSVGTYPLFESLDFIRQVPEFIHQKLYNKLKSIPTDNNRSTILIILIFDDSAYKAKDYEHIIKSIKKDFIAIFVITDFDSKFIS